MDKFPVVTLKKMSKLLKPIERISLNQLKDKLNIMGKDSMVWGNNKRIIINWSAMVDTLIIIAAIVAAIRKFKKYRKKSMIFW